MDIIGTLTGLVQESGFMGFFAQGGWKNLIMIAIACVLLYFGIAKKFEPLLLVGIAFGVLLTNLPGAGLYHMELWIPPASSITATAISLPRAVCWTFSISA